MHESISAAPATYRPNSYSVTDICDLAAAESQTELGNARRFIKLHGAKVRYCFQWRVWLVWDGRRWAVDRTGTVERLAKDVPDSIWKQATTTETRKFATKSCSEHAIRSMLMLARSELPISPGDIDCDPWLLNCLNGTLDLRTGVLRPHTQSDLITCLCPTKYDCGARSTRWESFLESTFRGDLELIGYVQRLLGYCLTGSVAAQTLPVFHGDGSNGKSTLLNSYMDMLGADYVMKAPPELLLARAGGKHPTEIADLHRKRFVAAVESPDGAHLNESLIKELTGGDRIRARRMHKDFFEFEPTHKIVLCTNHKPRVRGTDHGIWRRLAMVPFAQTFWDAAKGESGPVDLKIDPDLSRKLSDDREAVLAWCVDGCLAWQRDGLTQPQTVRKMTSEYQEAEDVIRQWICECCIEGAQYEVKAGVAFNSYRQWCEAIAERPVSNKKFGIYLKSRFQHRVSNGVWYAGLELNS